MRRLRGYPYLLALTILLTVSGAFMLVSGFTDIPFVPLRSHGANVRFAVALSMIFSAGIVCAIRRRVFTRED